MILGITWTHLESVWNPSRPSEVPLVLHKPVTGQELFFAVSYSKPPLVCIWRRGLRVLGLRPLKWLVGKL